ncbi:MAG: glycosyltransferase family 4 protein [Candidatus Krumholzibacteria bacterium]|nr:glycosyltransferase family 4 protein [Candidatus Krumholzibacteria bacterium]
MIGSRGLPLVYGGVERHVAEVGSRLAERGYDVTVFGRKPFSVEGYCLGMRVRVLPSIPTKNLETASNALAATMHVLFEPFDIVHYHGVGPSLFAWMSAARGIATVATIHAEDYRQSKWGAGARSLLRLGEKTAVCRSNAAIAVSRIMASRLEKEYGRPVAYIPNGAALREAPPFDEARALGLERGKYLFTVGRFIVERGFHTLLEAFKNVPTDFRMVIAGDARFEENYERRLKAMADARVVFPGYVAGRLLDELYAHCAFYVLPSTVEGLPISLLEAMSFSRPVLVSDIPENLEIAEGIAPTFRSGDAGDLSRALSGMLSADPGERERMGAAGRDRVARAYTWDHVTDEIEALYRRLADDGPRSN